MPEHHSSELNWYGDKPKSHTVLLFAELFEDQPPQSIVMHLGKEAYEGYQIFVYLKELLRVQNTDYICWSPGFELLYAAFQVLAPSIPQQTQTPAPTLTPEPIVFEEIGSTLFATIDKLVKLESRYQAGFNFKQQAQFYGVEVSQLFIEAAIALHSGFQIQHVPQVQELPAPTHRSIGRSYQATSYAFTTTAEFVAWISRLRFSLHGAWFNLTTGEALHTVLGKRIILFDPEWLVQQLQEQGYQVGLLSSDIYTLGDIEFLSVWFLVHQLSEAEQVAYQAFLNQHHITTAVEPCISGTLFRERARRVGSHAGMIFSETTGETFPQTFNFGNAAIIQQFSEYLTSL